MTEHKVKGKVRVIYPNLDNPRPANLYLDSTPMVFSTFTKEDIKDIVPGMEVELEYKDTKNGQYINHDILRIVPLSTFQEASKVVSDRNDLILKQVFWKCHSQKIEQICKTEEKEDINFLYKVFKAFMQEGRDEIFASEV